jgi:hypothetical protein
MNLRKYFETLGITRGELPFHNFRMRTFRLRLGILSGCECLRCTVFFLQIFYAAKMRVPFESPPL